MLPNKRKGGGAGGGARMSNAFVTLRVFYSEFVNRACLVLLSSWTDAPVSKSGDLLITVITVEKDVTRTQKWFLKITFYYKLNLLVS